MDQVDILATEQSCETNNLVRKLQHEPKIIAPKPESRRYVPDEFLEWNLVKFEKFAKSCVRILWN